MGRQFNMKFENEGYGIVVPLRQFSKNNKYKNYSVSCNYKFKRKQNAYSMKMWLKRNDIDGKFGMVYEEIDEQLVADNGEDIKDNICRIVGQMVWNGYIDEFIDRFEFDMLCCEKGFEILESQSKEVNENV